MIYYLSFCENPKDAMYLDKVFYLFMRFCLCGYVYAVMFMKMKIVDSNQAKEITDPVVQEMIEPSLCQIGQNLVYSEKSLHQSLNFHMPEIPDENIHDVPSPDNHMLDSRLHNLENTRRLLTHSVPELHKSNTSEYALFPPYRYISILFIHF